MASASPEEIGNQLAIYIPLNVVCLIGHLYLYKPWTLPKPFKFILPFVHVNLFVWSAFVMAALAVVANTPLNKGAPAATATIVLFYIVQLLALAHTYFFFVKKNYYPALILMTIIVFSNILITILCFVLTGLYGFLHLLLLLWTIFVWRANKLRMKTPNPYKRALNDDEFLEDDDEQDHPIEHDEFSSNYIGPIE